MNYSQISIKKILIIFSEVCFLIISVAIISSIKDPNPRINIENINSINLPNNAKNAVEEALYYQTLPYINNQVSISKSGAMIEEGSFVRYNDASENVYYIKFILEYNYLKFEISYTWSDNKEVLEQLGDVIEFKLLSSATAYNKKTNIDYYLPIEISLEGDLLEQARRNYPEPDIDSSLVTIILSKADTYSNKNKVLNYQVVACGDENIISGSHAIVYDWITSSGFDPDDYELNFIDGCEDN